MKTFPIILSAAMATTFVSCNQSPPPPLYAGNGTLAPAAVGDPLSTPLGMQAPAPVPASAPVQVEAPAPTPTPETTPTIKRNPNKYPLAVKTPQADIVLSPYKPYNKVRVDPKKFKPGQLAEDPDNRGSFFRVP